MNQPRESAEPRCPAIALAEWRLPCTGAAAFHLARRVGADGIQLELGGGTRGEWAHTPTRLSLLHHTATSTGIRPLAVAANILNDLGLPTPPNSTAERQIRHILLRLLDTTHALNAPLALVPSFHRSTINNKTTLTRTARTLAWAAQEAETRNIQLANENTLPTTEAKILIDAVASPAFRLILDTFNPIAAGLDPTHLTTHLAPHLARQIHLKEGPPTTGTTPPLGKGDARLDLTLASAARHLGEVEALVLENDYRAGRTSQIVTDLAWARAAALRHRLCRNCRHTDFP